MPESYQETALWKQLKHRASQPEGAAIAQATEWMLKQIQIVLGEPGARHVTLHDQGHALRVAMRMQQVVPPQVLSALSSYELALLLLSAYLHDVGMIVPPAARQKHDDYLVGHPAALTGDEQKPFRAWLDDQGYSGVPPLDDPQARGGLLDRYFRHRHADWGAQWIRNPSNPALQGELGTYLDWKEVLIRLCRSHQEGYRDLKSDAFRTRQAVGSSQQSVQLLYLALVLRMADILEISPDRAPRVLLWQRDVEPSSLLHWQKDAALAVKVEGGRVTASARPKSAALHHLIDTTLDGIDAELRLCRQLSEETPSFGRRAPHAWDLESSVRRDVLPFPDTYEYIQGTFRPDIRHVMDLLSGMSLYGNELAAVRELLQNAFDAVREQVAYERLGQDRPEGEQWELDLGKLHHVELRLETKDDGPWLVCSDDGVGMSKYIIEKYLLVAGTAQRHDLLELDRQCEKKNFRVGRTARFGIGVLSYFMIADRLVIETLRSVQGDGAWRFENAGIGSFGELRRIPDRNQPGTDVRLHLRPDIARDLPSWQAKLAAYLEWMLLHVPCQFRFLTEAESQGYCGPGWVDRERPPSRALTAPASEALPEYKRRAAAEQRQSHEQFRQQVQAALKWEPLAARKLDGVGCYRIRLPYFDLPGGVSLVFLSVADGAAVTPEAKTRASWCGMRLTEPDVRIHGPLSVALDIDWQSEKAGQVSVDRYHFFPNELGRRAQEAVRSHLDAAVRDFVARHAGSVYATLNAHLAHVPLPAASPRYWISSAPASAAPALAWVPVQFPAFLADGAAYQWKGRPLFALRDIPLRGGLPGRLGWHRAVVPPDRIVVVPRAGKDLPPRVVPLWTESRGSDPSPIGPTARFPRNWTKVVAAIGLWNPKHRLTQICSAAGLDWCRNFRNPAEAPRADLLGDPGRLAAWMTQMLAYGHKDHWERLIDQEPDFVSRVWKALFGTADSVFYLDGPGALVTVTPASWTVLSFPEDPLKHLPDPGDDFKLTVRARARARRA